MIYCIIIILLVAALGPASSLYCFCPIEAKGSYVTLIVVNLFLSIVTCVVILTNFNNIVSARICPNEHSDKILTADSVYCDKCGEKTILYATYLEENGK